MYSGERIPDEGNFANSLYVLEILGELAMFEKHSQ